MLLWMVIPYCIGCVLLFTVPDFSETGKVIYAFISYNLMATCIFTSMNVPYGVLSSVMTNKQNERALLSISRASLGALGVFVISSYAPDLVEKFGGGPAGWQKTFLLVGVVSIVLFLITFYGCKERVGSGVMEQKTGKKSSLSLLQGVKILFANKYWFIMLMVNIFYTAMTSLYGMNMYFAKYVMQDAGYNKTMMMCSTFASILVPLLYVVIASFMDPNVLNNQGLSFNIKDWTLDAYRRVLENEMIWRGFLNSFLYSLAFTVISVFVTLLAAYPLSKKEFVGRKVFNIIFLITMFFGGGMIPTFILINQLHMVNTVWAILIPGAFNVWNMILARTYYQSIPTELREASAIDGANEIQHFFKIMIPVCKPIIAVLALWSFVGMWNSYFDAMIYLNDANLQPLQLVLRSILVQNTPQPGMIADIQSTAEMAKIAEQLKYATIVVSSLPLLVMYPFFQKYFDKGIMVGSVKG